MLRRKVSEKLIEWKESKNNKCLVVQGARQVGKTFSIREFARSNYKNVLEINFKESPSAMEIFKGDIDIKSLIMAIRFRYPQIDLIPKESVIFLDEIQECPEAITSLKFWSEDGNYDVVVSGSLLGIDYNRPSSYPVGYVEYIRMYGLDFEEFLWANNISDDMIGSIRECYENKNVVPEAIHNRMMELFRVYSSLGGMPEVVDSFISHMDFVEVDRIQRQILQGYQYDIAHYADSVEKIKAEKCFMSLARQLLDKENHKFQYKEVEHGGRAQKYYSSIEWLLRADIIRLCRVVTDVSYDLGDYARDDFFRAYTSELSLLVAMKDYGIKQHIVENTLTGNTKGGLFESVMADILIKKDYDLYYYKNDTTKKEIDFLIQKDEMIIPIEVKSSNSKATSLNKLLDEKKDIKEAYKFIDGNIGCANSVYTMPLYMAMFL
ncbi:MAG: AAA family ATPase [Lachnospiraceae bacterium]|nr:AAA family ATPase [Lachnospiraceae bacterium]